VTQAASSATALPATTDLAAILRMAIGGVFIMRTNPLTGDYSPHWVKEF